MKGDIESQKDIEFLVDSFYEKVRENEEIGHFFNEVEPIDWSAHMPRMYAFWSDILLGTSNFSGNPMTKHLGLNKLAKMEKKHFDEWLRLWENNLSLHFNGPKADEALTRAKSIASMMHFKVAQQ